MLLEKAPNSKRKRSRRVLVGPETWDDAGIYRLNAREALVQTVDFFTPIVDSPYDFGAIAAANAVSDIYAMGAVPETALCLLGAPVGDLPPGVLSDILRGGEDALEEAGVVVLGGHSIRDPELKFGYAVTGRVDPRRMITNAGAVAGDLLVLTKPLGTGVLTTALKRQLLSEKALRSVTRVMRHLNAGAARAMVKAGAHAATDVTGFGLLGHARNIAAASKVTLRIDASKVPLMAEVEELIESGCYPGGLASNLQFLDPVVAFADHVSGTRRKALADPQTSGGMLIAVKPSRLGILLAALKRERTLEAAVIGLVARRRKHLVEIF